jgi:hypothetical protein
MVVVGVCSLMTLGAVADGSDMGVSMNAENIYVGGGLGMNSLSGFDDAIGFQIFGGYRFDDNLINIDKVSLSAEASYMTSGDFETSFGGEASVDGVWGAAVVDYAFNEQASGLVRLGLDLGGDDGLLFGFGGEYHLNDKIGIRGEYVMRSHVDSLQVNIVYDL